MKRLASALVIALGTLAATAVPAGADPGDDLVAGTGQGVLPTQFGAFSSQVHVNAKGDAADAHGQIIGRFFATPVGDVETRASVYCVNAVGNEAVVGAVIVKSTTPFVPVGSIVFRKVIDNGSGGNDPADQTGTVGFPTRIPCPPPELAPIATLPIEQGNFVVMDGG
jgi:hypothetical protein